MGLIDDLHKRVVEFNDQLTSGIIIKNIIWENEVYILNMNTEVQLYEQGVNNLGVHISDYAPYSPVTIHIKQLKGQPIDRVTSRDEGDFHDSFFLKVDDKQFEISASDFKTEALVKKYGRQILGLTDENIAELIWKYIYPDLIKESKKLVYGKN